MPTSNPGFVPPYPLGLILCDDVYVEPMSQKKAIIGTFSVLFAPAFPVQHPMVTVFLVVTDGQGPIPLRLCITDANEARDPIFDQTQTMTLADRKAVGEVVWKIGGLVFPEAGEYRVQTFAGNEPLLERRLVVSHVPQGPLQ